MQVTMKNEPLSTNGEPPKIGEQLPNFKVKQADGSFATVDKLIDRPTLISVVPNINTSVCSISTKHFNGEVDKFADINFYTISTNTPEEQKNWCAAEDVTKMKLLSDEEFDFGKNMGLFIADTKFDSRSIWIVDANKKVLYRELISELTNEPNYAEALAFLHDLK
ncbi:thiol peroxidase [Lactobacillus helsingborgensis]|uniref:thiol peroxidase n=1 Tax=Lactobacillus helsingborgensis TaxID=1218494 RepID=UPI00164F1FDC|nr:thiol peroxidase [Lactobacillus helsingborgensis]MBC6356038.1 thiol peroxidase [Lactobacillus helsingborgensis]